MDVTSTSKTKPKMSTKTIRLRISMYILTIVLHLSYFFVTLWWVYQIIDDPEIQYYYPFWTRFFTVWTVSMQLIHAIIGLLCDTILLNADGKVEHFTYLRSFNQTFFSAFVWPSSWVCSILFWFFFHYDDNLLCITILKKVGSPITYNIGHTFILFSVLWEAIFQPRIEPKSHKMNILLALSVVVLYIAVLFYTYNTSGTFIYPFYNLAYGTIYFPLIHLVTFMLTVLSYYAQWPIVRLTGFENALEKSQ